jgi:hypothetical protein
MMDKMTRQNVLALLTEEWGNYVGEFKSLSPDSQAAFLKKQGYKRLADLLAHIAAWWEQGMQAITSYKSDPGARQPEVDVDTFNADAVEKVRGLSEAEVMQSFEKMRRKFTDVISELSDNDFQDERITNQIRMELVNHLEDHRIN